VEPGATSGLGLRVLEARVYYDAVSGDVIHIHRVAVGPRMTQMKTFGEESKRSTNGFGLSTTENWISLSPVRAIYWTKDQFWLT
jgi:hypothetical protein